MPKTLLCVFNNCVGQNKSQLIMMFFAMLSVIPGHSHNRVVAWCRNAINEEQKPLHTNEWISSILSTKSSPLQPQSSIIVTLVDLSILVGTPFYPNPSKICLASTHSIIFWIRWRSSQHEASQFDTGHRCRPHLVDQVEFWNHPNINSTRSIRIQGWHCRGSS